MPDKTPLVGLVSTVKLSALPSMSLPVSVTVFAVSSAVVTLCALATGASFTAVTVTLTVPMSVNAPSLTA